MTDPEDEKPARKTPPPVTVGEDGPLVNSNGSAPTVPASQGEPSNFTERMNLAKLTFGQKLVGWSVVLIVVLTLIGYFVDRDSTMISGTLETLKLITTTALGFVFARTMESENKKND